MSDALKAVDVLEVRVVTPVSVVVVLVGGWFWDWVSKNVMLLGSTF